MYNWYCWWFVHLCWCAVCFTSWCGLCIIVSCALQATGSTCSVASARRGGSGVTRREYAPPPDHLSYKEFSKEKNAECVDFHFSLIFNCVTRLLILITVIVIAICIIFVNVCLFLSEDGYDAAAAHEHGWTLGQDDGIDYLDDDDGGVDDDAAAHEHGWTLGHLGRMMARPQWQQIPLPFHTSPNPEMKINLSVIIASSLIQSRLGPYYS